MKKPNKLKKAIFAIVLFCFLGATPAYSEQPGGYKKITSSIQALNTSTDKEISVTLAEITQIASTYNFLVLRFNLIGKDSEGNKKFVELQAGYEDPISFSLVDNCLKLAIAAKNMGDQFRVYMRYHKDEDFVFQFGSDEFGTSIKIQVGDTDNAEHKWEVNDDKIFEFACWIPEAD